MKTYDLVIVGGGPAGSTLARYIKDKRVLLINSINNKPCGGLLSPDAQKFLASEDIVLPKSVLVDPQIFSVKVIDLNSKMERDYSRSYINMDRKRFDEWLLTFVSDNVDIVEGRCIKIEGGVVTYTSNKKTYKVATDTIVGADGASSFVRRNIFDDIDTRKYTAIQQWFKNKEYSPMYSCIFDSETTDCCSWTINKDEYIIFGGAFRPKKARENFERQKEKLIEYGLPLREPVLTEGCSVFRPKSMKSFILGKEEKYLSVYLIGEAAGFISPTSLEGFTPAFKSAKALSESLQQKTVLSSYNKKTMGLRISLLSKNIKAPFMFHKSLRKQVMKSEITSIKKDMTYKRRSD